MIPINIIHDLDRSVLAAATETLDSSSYIIIINNNSTSSFITTSSFYFTKEASIVAACSSSISAISSLMIIIIIFRSQLKLSSMYNRIIFGMSSLDIIGSVAMAFHTIPMPREQVYSFQGSGTVVSCEVQAFLVLVGSMGCLCYNSGLSLFHICLIQFRTSERVMRKRIEPFIHVFSFLIPLSIAVSLVSSDC